MLVTQDGEMGEKDGLGHDKEPKYHLLLLFGRMKIICIYCRDGNSHQINSLYTQRPSRTGTVTQGNESKCIYIGHC